MEGTLDVIGRAPERETAGSALDPRDAPLPVRLLTYLLLVALVAQAAIAAVRDSVTIDEFVGLPVGLYTLQTNDFRSQSMNPPFFRSFAALPLLSGEAIAPRIPPMNEENDWAMGYEFMRDYGAAYQQLFVPARCMVILATALLAALVLQWATELYGFGAGLVALFLFSFSPNILAHAHLVTLDMSGAIGWAGVAYLTWRFLDSPTASRTIVLGMMLGVAPVLKLSALVLPIVTATLVLIRAASEGDRSWRTWLWRLLVANLLGLAILNAFYRFEGCFTPLGAISFDSEKMQAIAHALPRLRLPFAEPVLDSLDALILGDQPTEPAYFLGGSWSLQGWWYYHPIAFLLKTPLPLLFGGLFAIVAWALGRSHGKRDYCVILPIGFVFAANALLNPLNIGVRHALPAFPLLGIAASPWLAAPIERVFCGVRGRRAMAEATTCVALLAWFLYGSVSVAPRYLQYLNELAGGPDNGHLWLVDSNLDWGQDLIRLSEYIQRRHLESVHLAYFGRVDPGVYGIRFTPLVRGQSHGIAVVSASFLMGRPYWIWRAPGDLQWSHFGAFTWLRALQPVARVGSLFVFELP